jgi:hypothetical protein
VRQPRVRYRQFGADGRRIRFIPNILPALCAPSKNLEVLIPILYLKSVSTGGCWPRSSARMRHGLSALADSKRCGPKGTRSGASTKWYIDVGTAG